MSGRPVTSSRSLALWGGIAAYLIGTLLLYDAFEARGRRRPFAMRFLGGGV